MITHPFSSASTVEIPLKDFNLAVGQFWKILISGELDVIAKDRRILLRINRLNSGYVSYSRCDDDSGEAQGSLIQSDSAFCLGSTIRSSDADFFIEVTLAQSTNLKLVLNGLSTFAHGSTSNVIGFTNYGSVSSPSSPATLQLDFEGGVATGHVRVVPL